jgi:hypothetical protein
MLRLLPGALALCLLAGCPSASTSPARAFADARGRCGAKAPERNFDLPLEPMSSLDLDTESDVARYRSGKSGFFGLTRPPTWSSDGDGYPVGLRLTALPVLSPRQDLNVTLSFVNRSRGPLTLTRPPLDSGLHSLNPDYDLYLRPEGSNQTFSYADVRGETECGTPVVAAGRGHFVLPAGETVSVPIYWSDPECGVRLLRPGRYVLWAVYRNCTADPGRPDMLLGEYASNPVTVDVR